MIAAVGVAVERAWAGDHQHRDSMYYRFGERRVTKHQLPYYERQRRQSDHDRHKDTGYLIGDPLNGRA
ncbi:MAG: hypothetical protein U0670_16075 [Anaerolineae bacterium]